MFSVLTIMLTGAIVLNAVLAASSLVTLRRG